MARKRAASKRKVIEGFASAVLLASVVLPTLAAAKPLAEVPLGESSMKLGLTPFADELATTALAEQLLEKIGYDVTTRQVNVGIWFAGIAGGSMDAGFNAWLPITHGAYWKRYKSKLLDLGVVYKPTKQGWVVPDYVPKNELNSISDLKKPEVKKHLNGRITGISPGAGLMQQSEKAMKAYGLSDAGYNLQASSGPVMTASLARAIHKHEWIVVTGWTPHWMWQRFDLRYLKDPKNALGTGGKVHVVTGKDFPKNFPRATVFIKNFQVPVAGIEQIMNKANKQLDESNEKTDTAYAEAAQAYMKAHPEMVKNWLHPDAQGSQ